MPKILVTGATGFIGSALVKSLSNRGDKVIATYRAQNNLFPNTVTQFKVDSLATTNWTSVLKHTDCIIHLAGRAHVLNEKSINPLEEFRDINTEGTLNLARHAVKAKVKRLIFVSSIGVNGTQSNQPFASGDTPKPVEPYAMSKFEAEIGLNKIANETDLEIVIIRPPLVYGPEAPGNFERLIDIVYKGFPLPLGAINNKRSLIAIDNLIDFIETCIDHPKAANQTFMVSDDNDLSTTELLQRTAKALGKPARLIKVPASILTIGASLLGKREIAQRLCSSLQVDISHTKKTLNWTPPVSVDVALQNTADAYLKELKKQR